MREAALLINRALGKTERLRRRAGLKAITAAFEGLRVLEIGGPSPIFGAGGLLPVYSRLRSREDVNFAASTIWDGQAASPDAPGVKVAEATALGCADGAYDGLLASHVLEHVANPLGALAEWRRVVAPGGPLLVVLPHRDYTFDHRRDVTTLEHMRADAEAGTGEDDLTHLPEILERHDPRHDFFDGDREAFAQRGRENLEHRALHHHVFDTRTAVAAVQAAGLGVTDATARRPHHIVLLARAQATTPATLLDDVIGESPFPTDRGRR